MCQYQLVYMDVDGDMLGSVIWFELCQYRLMVVDVIFWMFCSRVGGGSGDFLRDFLVIIKLLSDGVKDLGCLDCFWC